MDQEEFIFTIPFYKKDIKVGKVSSPKVRSSNLATVEFTRFFQGIVRPQSVYSGRKARMQCNILIGFVEN